MVPLVSKYTKNYRLLKNTPVCVSGFSSILPNMRQPVNQIKQPIKSLQNCNDLRQTELKGTRSRCQEALC